MADESMLQVHHEIEVYVDNSDDLDLFHLYFDISDSIIPATIN